jgi:hypothetical protein
VEAAERETTITTSDADDLVTIWSAQPGVIGKLRRNPNFTEVDSGSYGSSAWARFTIPADRWNPATGAKRRVNLSDEQRVALRARADRMNEQRKRAS